MASVVEANNSPQADGRVETNQSEGGAIEALRVEAVRGITQNVGGKGKQVARDTQDVAAGSIVVFGGMAEPHGGGATAHVGHAQRSDGSATRHRRATELSQGVETRRESVLPSRKRPNVGTMEDLQGAQSNSHRDSQYEQDMCMDNPVWIVAGQNGGRSLPWDWFGQEARGTPNSVSLMSVIAWNVRGPVR